MISLPKFDSFKRKAAKTEIHFYVVIKNGDDGRFVPLDAAWMMISTKDAKNTDNDHGSQFCVQAESPCPSRPQVQFVHSCNWYFVVNKYFSVFQCAQDWQILSRLLAEANKFFSSMRYVRHYNFEWDTASSENNFGTWQVLSS